MPPCQPDHIPLHCARRLQQISDRLGAVTAKLDDLQEQTGRAADAMGHLSETLAAHQTRLTLLEAGARAAADLRKTWTGRLWQLAKAAALVCLGYLFKQGEAR